MVATSASMHRRNPRAKLKLSPLRPARLRTTISSRTTTRLTGAVEMPAVQAGQLVAETSTQSRRPRSWIGSRIAAGQAHQRLCTSDFGAETLEQETRGAEDRLWLPSYMLARAIYRRQVRRRYAGTPRATNGSGARQCLPTCRRVRSTWPASWSRWCHCPPSCRRDTRSSRSWAADRRNSRCRRSGCRSP